MKAWTYLSSGFTNFAIPSNIQKRLYKFLLRKAIGQFLATELDQDNFDVELVNGSLELRDLNLNLETLNDLLIDTPFILVEGHAASIKANLPWFSWSGEATLKVQGLRLTLKPTTEIRTRKGSISEEEESPLMSSSLHFADDFLKTEMEPDQSQELYESIQQLNDAEQQDELAANGLQVLTRVIEKMLAKVKLDIVDTAVRVIHPSAASLSSDSPRCNQEEYSLDIEIPKISYFDETPGFSDSASKAGTTSEGAAAAMSNMMESSILVPDIGDEIIKMITITSPKIWIRSRTMTTTTTLSGSQQPKDEVKLDTNESSSSSSLSQTEFFEAEQGDSTLFQHESLHESLTSGSTTPRACLSSDQPYEALLFTTMDKESWVRFKSRNVSPFDAPQIPTTSIDIFLSHVRTIITPRQTAFLLDLLAATTPTATTSATATNAAIPPPSPSSSLSTSSLATATLSKTPIFSPQRTNLEQMVQQRLPTQLDVSPPRSNPADQHRPRGSSSTLFSSSATTALATSQPNVKIKLQISLMEFFLLYDEFTPPSAAAWFSSLADPPTPGASHLKLWATELAIRLKTFTPHQDNNGRDKSVKSTGLRQPMPLPRLDTSQMHSTASSSRAISSIVDARIGGIGIMEWVVSPAQYARATREERATVSSSVKMKYDGYLPILKFDDSICTDYDDQQQFPAYDPSQPASQARHGGKRETKLDAVRLRLEKRSACHGDQHFDAASYDQDLNGNIQAFKLYVDPRIADRLENYAYILIEHSKNNANTASNEENISGLDNSLGQRIYEDLDNASKERQQRVQGRIRLAFIRVELNVPDMSQSSTRDEFNDYSHRDILSVDIKRVSACFNNDLSKHHPVKINIDLDWINVFFKDDQDSLARCWFTAKSQQRQDSISTVPQSPSIEITIRSLTSETSYPPSSARPGFFGAGSDIPHNLFEFLSRSETLHYEQKLQTPIEEQAESSLVFKQRTVETSSIVLNCHFPITFMTLSKPAWDKIQILQNDLILWQPRLITQIEQEQALATSSVAGSLHSEMFKMPPYRRYSIDSCHASILSQSQERLGQPSDTQNSSLFSVIAVMGEGVWDLHAPSVDHKTSSYRLQFTEFRYFAVLKHLALNENITTLDIEDLTLDDITDATRRIPLFYKTLPKSVTPKRNIPVISIFSRLTTQAELNKQTKVTSVVASNLCWKFTPDVAFLDDLIGFQKTPEDMVFIDPPTQYIKVYAHVLDISLDYKPVHLPSRAVVVLDNLQLVNDILAGQPMIDVKSFIQNVDVFLVDDVKDLDEVSVHQTVKSLDTRRYWSMMGMSCVLSSRNLEFHIKLKLDDMLLAPGLDVALLNDILTLEGCADSFQSIVNFVTYVVNDGDGVFPSAQEPIPQKSTSKSTRHTHTTLRKAKEDMLGSLDEEAFKNRRRQQQKQRNEMSGTFARQAPVPNDLVMVESFYSTSAKKQSVTAAAATAAPTSSLSTSSLRPRKPRRKQYQEQQQKKRQPEDIIRVLLPDTQEFDIIENFYGVDKKSVPKKPAVDVRRAAVSLRVRDVDIIWKLYHGYDWNYLRSSSSSSSSSSPPSDLHGYHPSASMSSSSTNTNSNGPRRPSSRPPSRPSSRPSSSTFNHRYSGTYSNATNIVGLTDSLSHNTSASELRALNNRSPSFTDRSSAASHSPPCVNHLERHTLHHPMDIGTSNSNNLDDYRHSPSSSLDSRKSASQPMSMASGQRTPRNGRRTRVADMELRMEGISLDFNKMVPAEQLCLHAHLEIRDVEVVDNISTSAWDTFFGCMREESPTSLPRETDSQMLVVDVIGVRPVMQDTTVEYRLKIETLPLRLFIDQDALNFLVQFFAFNPTMLRSTAGAKASTSPLSSSPSPSLSPSLFATVGTQYSNSSYNAMRDNDRMISHHQEHEVNKDSDIFFQHVEIHPINLKIDYKPKYINYDNIKEGQFAELLNLFQLEGAKLNLSAVKLTGVKGIPKLLERLGQEWLPHIKSTQVPRMVSGVSPIRSMVNLGSGVADLVLLPIQQYRKDGRVIKGIQKGTQSFARTTAMEIIKLSARLASGTQVIFEHADGLLSYGTAVSTASSSSATTATTTATSYHRYHHQQQQHHHIVGSQCEACARDGEKVMETRDGMASSSSSPLSTVIGSRTSEDLVFIFTDRNLGADE